MPARRGLRSEGMSTKRADSTDSILAQDELSEKDVRLLMRRINEDLSWEGGNSRLGPTGSAILNRLLEKEQYKLSPEQVEKGRAWLMKHYKNDMGYREKDVMDRFETITLIGTAPGERNNYQYPYYRVKSKPDAEGHRSTFEYKVEGGQLYILG